MGSTAMTVSGPVDASALGFTLPHEHLFIHTPPAWLMKPALDAEEPAKRRLADAPVSMEILEELRRDPMINKDNLVIDDASLLSREVGFFRDLGGKTIVDLSLPVMGRDPEALRRLSEDTGVNIIMGCGYYVQATHPADVASLTVDEVAEQLVDEARRGADGTEIRPGIIGEIGASENIHPDEYKVLHAAAVAQQETGLAINVHPPVPFGRSPLEIVEFLASVGAQLDRVIISHMDFRSDDLNLQRAIAERGVTLSFDRFGKEHYWESFEDRRYAPGQLGYREQSDWEVCRTIAQLAREGYSDRMVLSHDMGLKICLRSYGGHGYTHVQTHIARYLRQQGVDDESLRRMTVSNNERLLAAAA